jgi:chemosensory pili system protein ChpA (sensor histidine kinase/response regulator)
MAFAIDMSASVLSIRDTDETGQEALDLYSLALQDIAAAAGAIHAIGLQKLCHQLERQVQDLRLQQHPLTEEAFSLLAEWPDHLVIYLADPGNADSSEMLVGYLRDPRWPVPLANAEADALLPLLRYVSDDHTGSSATENHASGSAATNEPAVEPVPLTDEPVTTAPQVVSESMLHLLTNELGGIEDELAQLLNSAVSPELSSAERASALEEYAVQIERLGMAAEAIGLPVLKAFLSALQRRVSGILKTGLPPQLHHTLARLPGSVRAYLAAPKDPGTAEGLVDLLRSDRWASALDTAYASTLSRALSIVDVVSDAETVEARQTQARPEDIALTIPGDLSRELLDGLLQELPLHTSEFSTAIQHLASGAGSLNDIDVAKRAAHTLKGAANTVGIKGIANLTHHVEDILVALSNHGSLPNRALAEMLTQAGDCLEAMGEAVMGTGPEPDEALNVLQDILDWANRIDHEGIPGDDDAAVIDSSTAANKSHRTEQRDQPPASATFNAPQHNEAMVRVPAALIDELLRLMGETIISTGQVRERSRRLVERNKSVQQQNRVFLQLAMELEDLVELRGSSTDIGLARRDDEFDPLEFEHYSELHTLSRRLIEAATDSGELSNEVETELSGIKELVEVQNSLHVESQNAMMQTRMVPVFTVVSRLQRSVRQTSRLLDKHVALDVIGADTMIDSNILNELIDPLMHILRNAVDHGIESPEKRLATGKNTEGKIELSFLREGNQIVVRCHDDGAGLDLAAVRCTAEEKGLLTPEMTPSTDELARLILTPGFSTRSESTQISGRGIGMDVVNSRVLQLKGALDLHCEPGRGLEIELRLPATLIATHALIVRSHEHTFAIPSYGIQDIHYVTPDQIQQLNGENFFRLGETIYPLAHLDNLLNLTGDRRSKERQDGFPVLLVRLDSGVIHAVQLQKIIDSRELVVKGLGRYIPKPQGVVGATILGDGSVAAVIDVPELMRKPLHLPAGQDMPESSAMASESYAPHSQLTALVVDDSISARRATAQFMKDAGFEVRTAIDGLEAVAILATWKPDILLVDMEMPRMNGLELTAHVRAREGMANIPVIMITSRSTEKHRSQATAAGVDVYLTKPFGDEELLQHVTELTAA